jgi:hypothetical protein
MSVSTALRAAARRGLKGPSSRGEWRACCPFCEKAAGKIDVKFKLHMNPGKGVYSCFRCGAGGRADLAWLGELRNEPPPETPQELLGPPDGFERLRADTLSHRPFLRYLEKRGVLAEAGAVGVGCCLHGRYAGRVIFPHTFNSTRWVGDTSMGSDASWMGFVARSIYPEITPKYLYPAGMNRAGSLWGLHTPGLNAYPLFLVEGVFDALSLYPNAVASFGKNVTDEQIDILLDLKGITRLVVCLDGDAWEEARILQMRLKLRDPERFVYWCRLPPGTDPCSLGGKVKKYIIDPNNTLEGLIR